MKCLARYLSVCHGSIQETGLCKAHDDVRRNQPETAKAMGIVVGGAQMELPEG